MSDKRATSERLNSTQPTDWTFVIECLLLACHMKAPRTTQPQQPPRRLTTGARTSPR